MTVPVILPHSFGGVTFIVTSVGVTWYGVLVRYVSWALNAPGCVTTDAEASRVSVTVTVLPGATVKLVGFSDSHFTSSPVPHWSNPGRTSDLADALKPPVEPPTL